MTKSSGSSKRRQKKIVVIESPYASRDVDTKQNNVCYAHRAVLDSLRRGEAPVASHVIYTTVLDDENIPDRDLGIVAGLEFHFVANVVAFYTDRGWSAGMRKARGHAEQLGVAIEFRRIGV